MKKSKFVTGLSAAFISAMALMSCSTSLRARDGVILTIDGKEYTAAELFEDQKTPAAAEAKFNAVYKAAIRAYFKDHTDDNKEIENNTKIKISEQKATAQSNATTNGTSYAVEWKKILDSNGVENENELYHKFEYEFQKEKYENNFYEDNYSKLRHTKEGETPLFPSEYFKDYFTNKQPYHMKHILVKIAGLGNNNTDGTITDKEAEKLYNVIVDLANGSSFDQVSKNYSDDTAAKDAHSSLGIMSRDTSFVDDFKLGTYFYEAFYGKSTVTPDATLYKAKKAKDALFGTSYTPGSAGAYADEIRAKVADPTTSETLGVIPYEAALLLGRKKVNGYADFEYEDAKLLNQAGIGKSDFNNKFLPRNVIFNKFFNKHNIMVIAPAHIPTTSLTYNADIKESGKGSYRAAPENYIITCDSTDGGYQTLDGFNKPAKNSDLINAADGSQLKAAITNEGSYNPGQHVLRDEKGRTIFVFRSGTGGSSTSNDDYQGIHFVVIERSPFIGVEYDRGADDPSNKYQTDLDDYYTVCYPGQPGAEKHPQYEGTDEDKHTFANYSTIDKIQTKKDRADKVKSELKNCVPNLNTFIYEKLLDEGHIEFNPEMKEKYHIDIKADINDWIAITREDTVYEKEKNWNNNWQNYCYSLEAKSDERKEITVEEDHYDSRVISQLCLNAITGKFTVTAQDDQLDAIAHMFGVGGVFHE